METPLYDFLKRYAAGNTVRLHMPGHKGHHPDSALQEMARYDITEIAGADSLFEAEGVIREAERNTAALYETGDTCFLAGGSTLGIQTMLACCCMPGDTVLAARNAHKAFINTCALLDLNVQWLLPNSRDSFGVSGTVDAEQVREALAQGGIKAVYITSPDYMGFMSDIKAIADVCKEYGVPLLVDNAHGAHLKFMPKDRHPIALGASMCCESAHKTLPVLTGGAFLHIAKDFPVSAQLAKEKAALFGSTSPSYLILLSLDLCNRYLEERGKADFAALAKTAKRLRKAAEESGFAAQDGLLDDTKITLDGANIGMTGEALADYFREKGIECEYAGQRNFFFMIWPNNTAEEIDRLEEAIRSTPKGNAIFTVRNFTLPKAVMMPRAATFAPQESVKTEESAGRIAAQTRITCPPGVPLVVAGEEIDENTIIFLKNSGILRINVVKYKQG